MNLRKNVGRKERKGGIKVTTMRLDTTQRISFRQSKLDSIELHGGLTVVAVAAAWLYMYVSNGSGSSRIISNTVGYLVATSLEAG
jgi:hypothetical protein